MVCLQLLLNAMGNLNKTPQSNRIIALSPIFRIIPIFCNHFEELQSVLFKVKLIINDASLT